MPGNATWNSFNTEGPQILGAAIQNSVAQATRRLEFAPLALPSCFCTAGLLCSDTDGDRNAVPGEERVLLVTNRTHVRCFCPNLRTLVLSVQKPRNYKTVRGLVFHEGYQWLKFCIYRMWCGEGGTICRWRKGSMFLSSFGPNPN